MLVILTYEERKSLARWAEQHYEASYYTRKYLEAEAKLNDEIIIIISLYFCMPAYILIVEKIQKDNWFTRLFHLKPWTYTIHHKVYMDEDGPWWDRVRQGLKIRLSYEEEVENLKKRRRQKELDQLAEKFK